VWSGISVSTVCDSNTSAVTTPPPDANATISAMYAIVFGCFTIFGFLFSDIIFQQLYFVFRKSRYSFDSGRNLSVMVSITEQYSSDVPSVSNDTVLVRGSMDKTVLEIITIAIRIMT
jgi:hypothetical protein